MKFCIKFPSKKPVYKPAVCVSSRILILIAALMMPLHTQAGIENDMAGMFNSMGVESNYTQGGAFHGQSGSLYTGGSLSVRAPVSDISLSNIQLPSINSGCGGIDFFGGAFSFVNKEQFIQFTRNLGNNAAGVAFDLALKALDPMIQDAIGGIRDLANFINRQNMNSCQMAQSLVGGIGGAIGESMSSKCKASATRSGTADDYSEGSWYCQTADRLVVEANKISGKNTPQDTLDFTGGNLTYESVKNIVGNSGFGSLDMQFYYSILGTAVWIPPAKKSGDEINAGLQIYLPTITSANYLLEGKDKNKNAKTVRLDLLNCSDGPKRKKENCSISEGQLPSIRYIVKERITGMVNKIRTNSSWNAGEIRDIAVLVNNSRLPLLKMAVTDAALDTGNLQKDTVIDAIAIDFIASILDKQIRQLGQTTALYIKLDSQGEKERDRLFDHLKTLRSTVGNERIAVMNKVNVEMTMVRAMDQFDAQWKAAFTEMSGSMAFDTMNRL